MATNIYNYDKTLLTTVTDGTLDSTHASIRFPGRGYAPYGETVNENMLWIMQNFSGPTEPDNPVKGQTWFNTSMNMLKLYDGTEWLFVGNVISSPTAPAVSSVTDGVFWFDNVNMQMHVCTGTEWLLIGPLGSFTGSDPLNPSVPLYRSQLDSVRISDTLTNHLVWRIIIGGQLFAIISKDAEFTPNPAVTGFPSIKPGVNFNNTISTAGWPANSLLGGVAGAIPYQEFTNDTKFLAIGAENSILTSDGTKPIWLPGSTNVRIDANTQSTAYLTMSVTATSDQARLVASSNATYTPATNTINSNISGSSNRADNLVGGVVGSLPYQTASNSTTFLSQTVSNAGQVLTSTGSAIQWAPVGVPTGAVMPYAGSTAPSGWVLCDGSSYDGNTSLYASLWSVLGITYGGAGITDFKVPDLRGRAVFGRDNMGTAPAANRITSASGIIGTNVGASGGAETVTLNVSQMPSHTHPVQVSNNATGAQGGGGGLYGQYTTGTSAATGGDQAHQNMPPAIILNYIIKL